MAEIRFSATVAEPEFGFCKATATKAVPEAELAEAAINESVSVPLLKMGNEWRYYYTGTKYLHNSLSVPSNRYLGLSTIGYERIGQVSGTGTITTNLLAATDDPDLHVNAGASGGTLRIALLDSSGSVLPGYSESDFDPIVTDTYDRA